MPENLFADLEWLILIAGSIALFRVGFSPARRAALLNPNRLPVWPVNTYEFGLLLLLIIAMMIVVQFAAVAIFAARLRDLSDRTALETAVYGFAQHGGALLAWPLFLGLRSWLYRDHGLTPPALMVEPRDPSPHPAREGLGLLLTAVPVLFLVAIGWNLLLVKIGLPDDPQDLVGIISHTKSRWTIAALITLACVVVPCNEELIFRAAIFRFLRQRLGRTPAVTLSSLLFAALHLNWSSLLPLAVLGAVFALIYEKTGRIWVSMLAHSLFNLNSIVYILSGMPS